MVVELADLLGPGLLGAIDGHLAQAPWADGWISAAPHLRDIKESMELAPGAAAEAVNALISRALTGSAALQKALSPRRWGPIRVARYYPGMGFGPHRDPPHWPGTGGRELAIMIFLTAPGAYAGGGLRVGGKDGPLFRPQAGAAIAYAAGGLHEIPKVTKGVMTAAVAWVEGPGADQA